MKISGAFGPEPKEFYFWNTDPHNWSELSFQARSVRFLDCLSGKNGLKISDSFDWDGFRSHGTPLKLPPQYIALGDYTIHALPEGRVIPISSTSCQICVDKIYLFVNDIFNFEGEEPLGLWDLTHITEHSMLQFLPDSTPLWNSDFEGFKRHGYGHNLDVLSRLHELETFNPFCMEYRYAD